MGAVVYSLIVNKNNKSLTRSDKFDENIFEDYLELSFRLKKNLQEIFFYSLAIQFLSWRVLQAIY